MVAKQLVALAELDRRFAGERVDYWLFGGWAVDLHAGEVTRGHDDIDLAVWAGDAKRIAALLEAHGWCHAPEAGEDGYTGYERDGVRLELAFLARDGRGGVVTPLRQGSASWPDGAFGDDAAELHGVRVRVMARHALEADKATGHDDPVVAAKDRADLETLARARRTPCPPSPQ